MREKNHWSLRSFSTPGDDSWKESHWREAIQLHKVWQELLRIEILKSTIRGSNEVSGVFPHHNSWRELQWRETIQLHRVWQEIFMIKRLEVQSEDPWRKQPLKCNKCDRSFSTSGEDWWRESHWREAIQLHKDQQDQNTLSTIRRSMKETIEVSGGFPHHDSWKEWHWGEAIQVHKVWQELLIIKRIDYWSTTRGSMKDTTIEVHQMCQELFHIWTTLERSHSIAQSVARASQDQSTYKYHQRFHEGKNIQVHNLWQKLYHNVTVGSHALVRFKSQCHQIEYPL